MRTILAANHCLKEEKPSLKICLSNIASINNVRPQGYLESCTTSHCIPAPTGCRLFPNKCAAALPSLSSCYSPIFRSLPFLLHHCHSARQNLRLLLSVTTLSSIDPSAADFWRLPSSLKWAAINVSCVAHYLIFPLLVLQPGPVWSIGHGSCERHDKG